MLLSIAIIGWFIWSWVRILNFCLDYTTAISDVTDNQDKISTFELSASAVDSKYLYVAVLGIVVQFSLGFVYVVEWIVRSIVCFKNLTTARKEKYE